VNVVNVFHPTYAAVLFSSVDIKDPGLEKVHMVHKIPLTIRAPPSRIKITAQ
jgi:hypothetical protein